MPSIDGMFCLVVSNRVENEKIIRQNSGKFLFFTLFLRLTARPFSAIIEISFGAMRRDRRVEARQKTFPSASAAQQNMQESPSGMASASQADPVRGRAPATERAKRSGAVRRYSLVAAKPSGPPLRSSRLDRAACVSSSHKSFANAKSLREPLLQIHMQESPSGMASASQADPGGFDSRFLLHKNKGHSSEGRMLLCLFYLAEWSTSAAEALPFPAPY